MQISETELWALLNLLEPQGWNEAQFSIFYDESIELNLGHWRALRDLYREKAPRPEQLRDRMERLIWHDNEMFVGAQLDDQAMQASAAMMRSNAPPKRNMSRHTRGLLKRYQEAGLITMTIPERKVQDDPITMSPEERELYDDINELVNECYGNNPALNQTAVGFIMTVYRKRLGSSAHSYACSIQNHLDRREADEEEWELISQSPDEEPDVEDPDYILPGTTLTNRQHALLVGNQRESTAVRPSRHQVPAAPEAPGTVGAGRTPQDNHLHPVPGHPGLPLRPPDQPRRKISDPHLRPRTPGSPVLPGRNGFGPSGMQEKES